MVVRVVAIIYPVPGKLDEAAQNYLDVMPQIWAEKGCIEYHLNKTADSLVMIETWASEEDLKAHGVGPAVSSAREKNKDLIAKPAQVIICSPADPNGATGPSK